MELFPPIDARASGMLEVGDGHALHWEESGNPAGVPVLFVHGGPGAGTAPPYRRFFDPAFWRIVLFDQRGCGRSTPHAATHANTTAHLVADMEALRSHLGIENWVLFGGSWGSTLALAYGQAYPQHVLAFVLRGVFLFRPFEVEWFLHGMATFFPDAHARFADHVAPRTDLLAAYGRLLSDPDPAVHDPAARAWCAYEESCARLMPRFDHGGEEGPANLAMARLECHYMHNLGFLTENQLLRNMDRIRHLPCTIIQGRYDVICPPISAHELADAWPGAHLALIPDAGHSAMEPGIRAGLVAAMEGLKPKVIP